MESYHQLKSSFCVQKLPLDTPRIYRADEREEWLVKILQELQEGEATLLKGEGFTPFIRLDLEVTHRSQESLKDYLTLQGKIEISYLTRCVLTYELMEQRQEILVGAIAMMSFYQRSMNLYDEMVLFMNDREWDIFYYDRRVDMAEIIHEYIYLNKESYPKKKEEKDDVF